MTKVAVVPAVGSGERRSIGALKAFDDLGGDRPMLERASGGLHVLGCGSFTVTLTVTDPAQTTPMEPRPAGTGPATRG